MAEIIDIMPMISNVYLLIGLGLGVLNVIKVYYFLFRKRYRNARLENYITYQFNISEFFKLSIADRIIFLLSITVLQLLGFTFLWPFLIGLEFE